MLAYHHARVFLLAWLLIDLACAVALIAVANARGQSKWFALWAILGFGGLLIMLALPTEQPPAAPPTQPRATA